MNSIDKLISLANVRGSVDLRCQFQGDWALEHEQEVLGVAPYHIVLEGECRVQLPDGKRLTMRAGDILLLPAGTAHVIRSPGKVVAPIKPNVVAGNVVHVSRIGSASHDLDMLCGRFHYNRTSLLFSALPAYLVIPSDAMPANGPLVALVDILRGEADGDQTGARFLLDALSQALFTLMLRAHLATQAQAGSALALLADKRLGHTWQAILADPAHEWSIEMLAEAASMSRATFMRAFMKVAGVSPGVLLTQIRMELAFSLLSHSNLGLSDIAAQAGYQSQAAFSKKFKEVYGEAPGRVRKGI
ncbi:AraC family transcriptional regulator [Pseudomonas petrae]|uniref:AraC family transcriptional regulator n=1 Tax=Pseudomonas petrae TaxID=2912190 RepID=A0ABS9IED3_9PSED|nr:AraC family transcriptional regulator [Pseudomonas petrae]MCF7545656.1 AraC family transcriptional regulator [Pseudomonas petrae]